MKQIKTGTEGLDELLNGGLPERRNILVSGSAGTGKTILGAQFLSQGVKAGEPALHISFEQDEKKLAEDLIQIGIDTDALEKTGNFKIIGGPIGALRRAQYKTKAKKQDILGEILFSGKLECRLPLYNLVVQKVEDHELEFRESEKGEEISIPYDKIEYIGESYDEVLNNGHFGIGEDYGTPKEWLKAIENFFRE